MELRENMKFENTKLSSDIIAIKNEATKLTKVNLEMYVNLICIFLLLLLLLFESEIILLNKHRYPFSRV